jgi:hypothetical protein
MSQKILLNAFMLVALCTLAQAQTRFDFGVTAGVNYSSLRSDVFTTSSGRIAPAIGFSFAVGLSKRFELNQEVVFTMKGAKARALYYLPEEAPAENTYNYHYNTFETALFAGFRPSKDFPFWLQGGAFMGTHFAHLDRDPKDLRIGDYENVNNSMAADDLNDAFSGLDFGPAIGFSVGEGHFRATARYYLGVQNLYNNLDFVPSGPHIRTSALRMSLTYFL